MCKYCNYPFKDCFTRIENGYQEYVHSFEDNEGTYFAFEEIRPDGTYSRVGLDTFKYCPMCGREL